MFVLKKIPTPLLVLIIYHTTDRCYSKDKGAQ